VLAIGCALGALVIGQGLHWGFGTSVLLALVAGCAVYGAASRAGGRSQPAVRRQARPPAAPRLAAGHEIIAVRNLGGMLTEQVPQGSRGVVTAVEWGRVEASFTVLSPLGSRQVQMRIDPHDVRRI